MKLKPKMLMGIGIPLIVVFIIMGFTIYMMASAALRDTVQIAMNQRANHYAARRQCTRGNLHDGDRHDGLVGNHA